MIDVSPTSYWRSNDWSSLACLSSMLLSSRSKLSTALRNYRLGEAIIDWYFATSAAMLWRFWTMSLSSLFIYSRRGVASLRSYSATASNGLGYSGLVEAAEGGTAVGGLGPNIIIIGFAVSRWIS